MQMGPIIPHGQMHLPVIQWWATPRGCFKPQHPTRLPPFPNSVLHLHVSTPLHNRRLEIPLTLPLHR